jgi:hypothetical protein
LRIDLEPDCRRPAPAAATAAGSTISDGDRAKRDAEKVFQWIRIQPTSRARPPPRYRPPRLATQVAAARPQGRKQAQ